MAKVIFLMCIISCMWLYLFFSVCLDCVCLVLVLVSHSFVEVFGYFVPQWLADVNPGFFFSSGASQAGLGCGVVWANQ